MLNFFNKIVAFVSNLLQTNPILGVLVLITLLAGSAFLLYKFWNFALGHYLTWLTPLAQTLPLTAVLLLKETIRAQLSGDTASLFITILCIVYFTLAAYLHNLLLAVVAKKSKNGQLIISVLGLAGLVLWGVLLWQAFGGEFSAPAAGGGEGGGESGSGGRGGEDGELILPR